MEAEAACKPSCVGKGNKSLLKPTISNAKMYKLYLEKKLGFGKLNGGRRHETQYCAGPEGLLYSASESSILQVYQVSAGEEQLSKKHCLAKPSTEVVSKVLQKAGEDRDSTTQLEKNSDEDHRCRKEIGLHNEGGDELECDLVLKKNNCREMCWEKSFRNAEHFLEGERKCSDQKHYITASQSSVYQSGGTSTGGLAQPDLKKSMSSEKNEEIYECYAGSSKYYSRCDHSSCPICENSSRNTGSRVSCNDIVPTTSLESSLGQDKFKGLQNNSSLCRSNSQILISDLKKYDEAYRKIKFETRQDGVSQNVKLFLQNGLKSGMKETNTDTNTSHYKESAVKEMRQELREKEDIGRGRLGSGHSNIPYNKLITFPIRSDGIALQRGISESSSQLTANSVIKFEKRFYVVYNKPPTQPKTFWKNIKNHCFLHFLGHLGT